MARPHPLLAWMTLEGLSKHDVARLLDVAVKPNTIRQIAYGHRRPSWDLAFSIERATKGRIKASDLRADGLYDDTRSRAA